MLISAGRDRADLRQVALVGLQPPLRVEGQPDVRPRQQLLVALGLGEEVGAPRLQVEHDVDARLACGVDPGTQQIERRLVGVVAVGPGAAGRHGGDDLEGRNHGHVDQRLVVGGQLLGAGDGAPRRPARPGRPSAGVARVAVEGDHLPSGVEDLPAAGQLHAAGGYVEAVAERLRRAEGGPERHDLSGWLGGQRRDHVGVGARIGIGDGHEPRPAGTGRRGCRQGRRIAGHDNQQRVQGRIGRYPWEICRARRLILAFPGGGGGRGRRHRRRSAAEPGLGRERRSCR